MYMVSLIIIYDVVNIFSMKNFKSLRKLWVGVNGYTGVNWSTTTRRYIMMGSFKGRGNHYILVDHILQCKQLGLVSQLPTFPHSVRHRFQTANLRGARRVCYPLYY